MKILPFVALAFAASFAACADATAPATASASPSALRPTDTPSALLGPNEGIRTISDTTDAAGTTTTIAEYPAGIVLNDTVTPPIGSVVIKTVIPAFTDGSSKEPCITSTIVRTETVAGWTASVKKPGGCDKPIEVQFENKSEKKRADFSFLFIPGKTRIDLGLIK
jgi:hypothetical protein